jgi:hypothetical protein
VEAILGERIDRGRHRSTNTEPGAVATGSFRCAQLKKKLMAVACLRRRFGAILEPVATAPGSEFVRLSFLTFYKHWLRRS